MSESKPPKLQPETSRHVDQPNKTASLILRQKLGESENFSFKTLKKTKKSTIFTNFLSGKCSSNLNEKT